jgi:hypothetical protein
MIFNPKGTDEEELPTDQEYAEQSSDSFLK